MTSDASLERFVDAQRDTYTTALAELTAGRKRSHWMWYIFPQLKGLGRSTMAQIYAIADLTEARAYLVHPVLGPRLRECVDATLTHNDIDALALLGSPDNLKYRSCLTLFRRAVPTDPRFDQALDRYYERNPCEKTLELLLS